MICARCGHEREEHANLDGSSHCLHKAIGVVASVYDTESFDCVCHSFVEPHETPRLRTVEPEPLPPAPEPAALDFLSALRSGRPFRRRVWVARGPAADDVSTVTQEKLMQHVWLYPQVLFPVAAGKLQIAGPSIFRNIATGELAPLTLPDYLATDWETMP